LFGHLAEALGVRRVRLSEIMRGKRAITPDTVFRLARFLDAELHSLDNLL